VIPAFNEGQAIQAVLRELLDALRPVRELIELEIVVVDDGSIDNTFELAGTFESECVRVVRHSVNRGYGAAIKTGVRHALHDWIVITDADGTYPGERIAELLELRRESDMIVGARVSPGARIPLLRRPPKWVLRQLAQLLTRSEIPDLNSGFRVIRRIAIERFAGILPDGFSFTTTITIAMLSSGFRVTYLPIDYRYRVGSSKIRPIADTVAFLGLVVRASLFFNPLRVFLPVALGFIAASALVAIVTWMFMDRLMDVTTLLLFVTGIQLLALGLIADLVNRKTS
jgi:glycosyltransferase involved in cell wall biosynthesis